MNRVFKRIALILVFILAVAVFAILGHEVVAQEEDWFDRQMMAYLDKNPMPGAVSFFRRLTILGSPWFLVPAYLIMIFYLFAKKKRQDAIEVLIISLSSLMINFALKFIYERPRPVNPLMDAFQGYSFPSGHAFTYFVFSTVIFYLVWKGNLDRWKKFFILLVLIFISFLIGLSRIVLRHHYASDVLAGFCVGVALVVMWVWLRKRFRG